MAKKKKNDAKLKHKKNVDNLSAPPPRTSGYDKKTGKQVTGAQKCGETKNEVHYRWIEDSGGDKVQVKTRKYLKDHAKARFEKGTCPETGTEDWVTTCGNHCKIDKDKFDPNYDEIFGKKDRGAATGKFKKFKKKY